jgi:hypothetical protein
MHDSFNNQSHVVDAGFDCCDNRRESSPLYGAARMAESVECDRYGAVMTEDEATHGYYIVQWTFVPYMLQEATYEFQEGELVCDATYLNPVGRAKNWYTPGTSMGEMLIRIQHVVAGDVELRAPSPTV